MNAFSLAINYGYKKNLKDSICSQALKIWYGGREIPTLL